MLGRQPLRSTRGRDDDRAPRPGRRLRSCRRRGRDCRRLAHSCALTSAGTVKCWGRNEFGELGDGTKTERHRPVGVIGFGAPPPPVRCVVPNVVGRLLASAKTKIIRAHCRVGTVKRVASPKKKNTVVGESPQPGKRLKRGAKVNLKVSRGR